MLKRAPLQCTQRAPNIAVYVGTRCMQAYFLHAKIRIFVHKTVELYSASKYFQSISFKIKHTHLSFVMCTWGDASTKWCDFYWLKEKAVAFKLILVLSYMLSLPSTYPTKRGKESPINPPHSLEWIITLLYNPRKGKIKEKKAAITIKCSRTVPKWSFCCIFVPSWQRRRSRNEEVGERPVELPPPPPSIIPCANKSWEIAA